MSTVSLYLHYAFNIMVAISIVKKFNYHISP